jgi:hypothetical protein
MVNSPTRNFVNNNFFSPDSRASNNVQPCSTKLLPNSQLFSSLSTLSLTLSSPSSPSSAVTDYVMYHDICGQLRSLLVNPLSP